MKFMRQFGALLLVLAMVLAMVPMTAAAVNITEEQVKDKIEAAKKDSRFKPGTVSKLNPNEECLGFLAALFEYIFGVKFPMGPYKNAKFELGTKGLENVRVVDHLDKNSEAGMKRLLSQAKPGDVLVVTRPNLPYGHVMMIIKSNNDGESVDVYDANWGCVLPNRSADINKGRHGSANTIKIHDGKTKMWDAGKNEYYYVNPYTAEKIAKDYTGSATLYHYVNYMDGPQIKEDVYALVPRCAPSACLDVKGNSTENGANVQIWENCHTANQQWKVESVGDGYYKLVSQRSGRCLDVSQKDFTSGTNVQQYDFSNVHDSQRWRFEDAGDGYYYIISKGGKDLCLDVSGGGKKDGTNVQIYTKNQTDAQKWKLVPVNCTTHNWGSWVVTKEATCLLAGQRQCACTNCGEVKTEAISALTHNYKLTSSTATKDVYTCSRCNLSYEKAKSVVATPTPTPTPASAPTTPTPAPQPEKSWGAWSEWSTTKVTPSATRQVETRTVVVAPDRTEYRYGRYMAYDGPKKQDTYWCATYARARGYARVSGVEYTSWSTTRIAPSGSDYSCGNCKGPHVGVDHYSSDGRAWWHIYKTGNSEYYWEESRWISATTRTEYRYRDYK